MDFGALPPEVNSTRMYVGAGSATMLAAAAGWETLAAELHATAGGYQAVIGNLTDEAWAGPSSAAMANAVTPYLTWMRTTAEQCQETSEQATAAAAAYESAYAMTVPPPLVFGNRTQLATLVATNVLGQNTPAIAATEAEYSEMWAQDATAMYTYAAGSAVASAFNSFTTPPQTTNPAGLGGQVSAMAQSAGSQLHSMSTKLIASVSQALQSLAGPGSSSASAAVAAPSGASGSVGALTSLTSVSGKSLTKSVGATANSATSLVTFSGLASLLSSSGAGISADAAGLGSDAAGLGTDVGGLGLDFFGTGLDLTGADSILGSEGIPGALGGLGPVDGLGALADPSAGLGQAAGLGTLSVPPSWADALSVPTPLPELDANVMPGGWGAASSPAHGAPVSRLPVGGMVGRDAGTVQRIGFRASVVPHSPFGG